MLFRDWAPTSGEIKLKTLFSVDSIVGGGLKYSTVCTKRPKSHCWRSSAAPRLMTTKFFRYLQQICTQGHIKRLCKQQCVPLQYGQPGTVCRSQVYMRQWVQHQPTLFQQFLAELPSCWHCLPVSVCRSSQCLTVRSSDANMRLVATWEISQWSQHWIWTQDSSLLCSQPEGPEIIRKLGILQSFDQHLSNDWIMWTHHKEDIMIISGRHHDHLIKMSTFNFGNKKSDHTSSWASE